MAIEIERKFLVDLNKWKSFSKPSGDFYRQGYIVTNPEKTIRVRLTEKTAFLTIKGISEGASRAEFEYEIPTEDAQELLDSFAISNIEKRRYTLEFEHKIWEVDEFLGENEGLIVAEIELNDENEAFVKPDWIVEEVTGQKKYYNSQLSTFPFKKWGNENL